MNSGAAHALHRQMVPYPDFGPPTLITAAAPYTVLRSDTIIAVDSTVGNGTVNLPPAAQRNGRVITIKKNTTDFNSVAIVPAGADTIELAAGNAVLPGGALPSVTLVSDGVSNWLAI